MATSRTEFDLRQMIVALETMVDLVGISDTYHAKRVGYMASQIAHKAGMDEANTEFAFELGLLHDCGVSTEQMHKALVNHFDWQDSYIHCEIGYRLLAQFPPLARFAIPIRHHHTPWAKLKHLKVDPLDARMANLVFLADRVDIMAASHYDTDILLYRDEIVSTISGLRNFHFKSDLVDAFIEAQQPEAFWIALEQRHVVRYAWDMSDRQNRTSVTLPELRQLAGIMAYIVDQKSPFTAEHSARVGALARHLATRMNLSECQIRKIEIAGLLHDLGKLRMPDEILEKAGPLDPLERSIMNQHSYETYEILRHIDGLEDIALWAAYHHEGVARSGYPFHPAPDAFPLEARIIAVADVFQALVQDRPYRKGMTLDEVLEILDSLIQRGQIDPTVVEQVKADADTCYAIAHGPKPDDEFTIDPSLFSAESANLGSAARAGW